MRVKKKTAKPKPDLTIFTIRFTEGLADRNRLPLDHVIRVLTEIKAMIEAVGERIQREGGMEDPTGDFGLELIGGFQKGSVKAALAITRNVKAGIMAASQVLDTVTRLSDVPLPRPRAKKAAVAPPRADYDHRMVARLGTIGKVQEIDKTKVVMRLAGAGVAKPLTAVFDRKTSNTINTMREPNFGIEDLTVYGKLRELRDKYEEGQEGKKPFIGELLGDDGLVWRVEFKAKDLERVTSLFRHQVAVTGAATYYKAMSPRLAAVSIEPDEERDYEKAFDELYGASPELVGVGLDKLIGELETD